MTVFAIMSTSTKPELEAAVEGHYPDAKSYRISDTAWLVSDKANGCGNLGKTWGEEGRD